MPDQLSPLRSDLIGKFRVFRHGTGMRQVCKVCYGGARRACTACFQEFGKRLQIERRALSILAPGIRKI
jgi:hypothetical protein